MRLKPAVRTALAEADSKRQEALDFLEDSERTNAKLPLEAACSTYQRLLGSGHPMTLKCQTLFISLRDTWKDRERTLKEYQDMLPQLERHVGKDDPWTFWCAEELLQNTRSSYTIDTTKNKEAETLARRIVSGKERVLGKDHRETAFARLELVKVLSTLGKFEEKEKLLIELTAQLEQMLGKTSQTTLNAHADLGHTLLQNGEPQMAFAHLQTALIFAPLTHKWKEETLVDIALCLNLLDRPTYAFAFAMEVDKRTDKGTGASVLYLPTLMKYLRKRIKPDYSEEPTTQHGDNQGGGTFSPLGRIAEIGFATVSMQALAGDPECQYLYGYCHQRGVYAQESAILAHRWLKLAAENGNVKALTALAEQVISSESTSTEQEEGVSWARLAAEKGSDRAMFILGYAYLNGYGVAKHPGLMLKWFEKSAAYGHLPAYRVLGTILSVGDFDVGQDLEAACKWLTLGAAQDDAICLFELGRHYYRGEGLPREPATAISLWRRAAEQGFADAQHMMGLTYISPKPEDRIVQDRAMAYYWLALAAAKGHAEAAEMQQKVIQLYLSKDQKTEMDGRIKKFTPRPPKPIAATEGNGSKSPGPPASGGNASGTGFFITQSGHLVTNHHVIKDATSVRVRFGSGQEVDATILAKDRNSDLAVLKVALPSGIRPGGLPIAISGSVKLGATVATVGFPNFRIQGLSPKLAKGDIASLAGLQDNAGQFQISVPLQPGNSGGALVDLRGNVVGIVCAILDQEVALATSGTLASNVSYAVKSSLLMNLIESIPGLPEQLQPMVAQERPFEDVVETVQQATVMLLITQPLRTAD